MGTLSLYPWDLPQLRQNVGLGREKARAPWYSGRRVDAPVASLRCRIPRSGVPNVSDLSIASRSVPVYVSRALFCMYYGPDFTSRHFLIWCEEPGVRLLHIQPGRPMQNGHVESFNGRFRDECLNHHLVHDVGRCKGKDRAMADGIQRGTTAQQPGISNAGRIRGILLKAHQQDGSRGVK
jgi:hypothetical protein